MCANWGATTTVLAKSTTKSDTSKKQIDIVSDQLGQKIVVYDGHHFRQAPDQNGALLFRCVRYEWSKCPANILVTKRTKTIGLPHNHDDFAISTDELKIEPNKSGLMNLISTPQEVNRNTIKGSVTRRVTLASKSKRGRKLNMPDTIDNDTSSQDTGKNDVFSINTNFQTMFKKHFNIKD